MRVGSLSSLAGGDRKKVEAIIPEEFILLRMRCEVDRRQSIKIGILDSERLESLQLKDCLIEE